MEIGRSRITALPLGDGEKLRGFRFQRMIIDEFLLMPEKIFTEVITPFLAVVENPTERQNIHNMESKMIAEGKMTEDERTIWPNNKIIGLSSASYKFEYLYKIYQEYENLITYVVDDSVHFLENLNEQIDFLYLDSLDSESPLAHHHQLKEIKAAYSKLHQSSVVLLDDLGSKTNLSIEFLKNNNWCQIKIDIPRPSHYNNFMQGLFVKEEFFYVNHSLIPHHLRFKDL